MLQFFTDLSFNMLHFIQFDILIGNLKIITRNYPKKKKSSLDTF